MHIKKKIAKSTYTVQVDSLDGNLTRENYFIAPNISTPTTVSLNNPFLQNQSA